MKNEPHLSQLTNLNTLSFCLEGSLTHNDREDIPEVLEAIGASVRTLRSLSVCGWALWRSPIHTLRDLTHLEIFGTQSVANLSLLFRHNVRLESFSLGYRNNSELSEVLREHPDALPHLHSFKLITEWDYMEMDHMENLKAFLLTKPRLRRFDIQAAMPWYGSSPIVEVLRALPSLEVLGLELGGVTFTMEDYAYLRDRIPQGLTSFYIQCYFPTMFVETTQWVDLVSCLSSLSDQSCLILSVY